MFLSIARSCRKRSEKRKAEPVKSDERELLDACKSRPEEFPREIMKTMSINRKRALYLLDKWADKGWYEYGTSLDLGWLTKEGIEAAESER